MTSSVKLGRIARVEIGVNWSWVITFGLIVWLLAAAVFPARSPGLDQGTYVAMGAGAAVAFFSSLVLHELGHALQARRDGVPIDGITLWLFGGVARFSAPFPSPGAEFRIALAGPVVSLALGIGFSLAAVLGLPAALEGMLGWLGYINLVLLAFNLLPALPLDGGRVVRAAIWRLRGDFVGATHIAAGLGGLFGGLMVGLGIALLLMGGVFAAIWIALVGWFLLLAAEAERRQASDRSPPDVVRSALEGVRVGDVMVEDPAVVGPDLPLREFASDGLTRRHQRSYPVLDGNRPLGLVSFRATSALACEHSAGGRVAEHMIPLGRAPTLSPEQPASDALVELAQGELSAALVCQGERLVGLVSISDLGRLLERAVPRRESRTSKGGPRRRHRTRRRLRVKQRDPRPPPNHGR